MLIHRSMVTISVFWRKIKIFKEKSTSILITGIKGREEQNNNNTQNNLHTLSLSSWPLLFHPDKNGAGIFIGYCRRHESTRFDFGESWIYFTIQSWFSTTKIRLKGSLFFSFWSWPLAFFPWSLVAPRRAHNHEDVEEEVDDVQVEIEGGEDVLLRADAVLVAAAHHELYRGKDYSIITSS